MNLGEAVRRLGRFAPYDEVDLMVETAERKIQQRTTAQTAFSSMMGLLMVCRASNCLTLGYADDLTSACVGVCLNEMEPQSVH